VDDISGGQNNWSKSPETLRREGYAVSDYSNLPTGRYRLWFADFLLWVISFDVKCRAYNGGAK
jgi:hypothetical protein